MPTAIVHAAPHHTYLSFPRLRTLHYFPLFFSSHVHQYKMHISRPIASALSIISAFSFLASHFFLLPAFPSSFHEHRSVHKDSAKFSETEEANKTMNDSIAVLFLFTFVSPTFLIRVPTVYYERHGKNCSWVSNCNRMRDVTRAANKHENWHG